MRLTADGNPAIEQMAIDDLVFIQVDRQPFELLVLVPAWMSSDCCRSRRGLEPHDLDVLVTGTRRGFETLLIENRDGAPSVADQFPAL